MRKPNFAEEKYIDAEIDKEKYHKVYKNIISGLWTNHYFYR